MDLKTGLLLDRVSHALTESGRSLTSEDIRSIERAIQNTIEKAEEERRRRRSDLLWHVWCFGSTLLWSWGITFIVGSILVATSERT